GPGELELTALALPEYRAPFELSLFAAELPNGGVGGVGGVGGMGLALEARSQLFDRATIARMLGHLATLLAGVVSRPSAPLPDLPLLSAAERQQLESEWNDTAVAWPTGDRLEARVWAQAARTPDAVAVVGFGGERLSYQGLAERALRLASRLRQQGVGPESRVGLCLSRTPDLIVAILGILEAGGAYVPLDPAYPDERLAFMLADSEAGLLVTEPGLAGRFAGRLADRGLELVGMDCLTGRTGATEPSPASPAAALPGADRNLAYVIYTSGSTGRPKGVGVEHHSAVAFLRWAARFFSPQELAGVLAATSVGFDLSIFEIFAPLTTGGRVLLAPSILSLPELASAGVGEEISLINTVPSPMAELVQGPLPAGARTINLAGEALPPELAARLYARPQISRVVNLYGPSEDTTYSTVAAVPREAADTANPPRVTIGRSLANRRARVIGRPLEDGEPLPVGVPGELVLAGGGLARGYLGRPELTALRFIPDPWGPPGARMYRTGDRVRRLPDGELDFLGRLDDQVKIRGFRIEPGEIAAVLAAHPALREAVVLALPTSGGSGAEREAGELRLAALVAPSLPGDLRSFAASRLPAAMVPAAWFSLPVLPRTGSGKVDRAALARHAATAETVTSSGGGPGAAPSGPTEELLAGIWSDLLGAPPGAQPGARTIGRDDDFFALGGHSLLATRAAARISRLWGIDLAVTEIFAAPTVARLAARLDAARPGEALPPIERTPPSSPSSPETPPVLSFAQQRLWFLEQLHPGTPVYNLPGALEIEGRLDVPALSAALAAIVERHEPLRTAVELRAGEPLARLTAAPPGLPVVDLSALAETARRGEMEREAQAEARRPFDLARGPLLRSLLLRLEDRRHLLLTTFHHIAADGWSLGLFLAELGALLAAEPLAALPVRYSDFAAWQARGLREGRLDGQLDYWRERLSGLPVLDLPTDRPRRTVGVVSAARDFRNFRGIRRELALTAAEGEALVRFSQRSGVTVFMTLLGAFQALLARWSGEARIAVGSPVANRRQPEVEPLIGLFVNTLVLDVRLGEDPSFPDLLMRVREACLGAYAHQDLPFEQLVELLQPGRDLGQNPLFQVMLVLEEPLAPRGVATGGGELTLKPRRRDSGTAKFDLLLAATPRADGGWELAAEYAAALWEEATVDRVLAALRTLLANVATQASDIEPVPLSALPWLAFAEGEELRSGHRRSALPIAAPSAPGFTAPRAPRNPREERLAAIFSEILGRSVGSVGDSFFELGGHSLLAVRAAFRIGAAFGVELPVGAIFETPTVAALAERLAGAPVSPVSPVSPESPETATLTLPDPAAAAEGSGQDRRDPLSLAQQRLWFASRLEPESTLFNLSVALHLTGRLHFAALRLALAEILRRHEPLRTVYFERGERGESGEEVEPVQIVLAPP
ncbi:MAG TPA: amino acid adenylation domain-containing protein, partial [Thermoanaerobaculia bacterium]|nr:amino acid adenylation domain-containing protein [Thermoanaerobaculia bacterium]